MNEAHPAIQSTDRGKPSVIGEDLPCANCAYNLRTLSAAGRCPECGAAVAETLALTQFAAIWLADLDRGVLAIRAGFFVFAVALFVCLPLMMFGPGGAAGGILLLAGLATLMCWAGGTYELTRPQPGSPDRSFLSPGTMATACIVAVFVEFVFLVMSMGLGGVAAWVFPVLLILMLVTMLAVPVLLAIHVGQLAHVFKSVECARPSRWVVAIGCSAAAVLSASVAIGVSESWIAPPLSVWLAIANVLFWIAILLLVCLCVAVLVMLYRLRKTLTYLRRAQGAAAPPLEPGIEAPGG